jgi:hypothetical protein
MGRAYDTWLRRLRSGDLGEIADKPSTWKYDHLWSAACYERNAEDCRRQGLEGAAKEWDFKVVQTLGDAFNESIRQDTPQTAQRPNLRIVR